MSTVVKYVMVPPIDSLGLEGPAAAARLVNAFAMPSYDTIAEGNAAVTKAGNDPKTGSVVRITFEEVENV